MTLVFPITYGSLTQAVEQIDGDAITGAQFATLIEDQGLDATNITVRGDVELQSGGRVPHLVRCLDCTIIGAFRATDIVFERVVDLSGLEMQGPLDLHAATFANAFLIGRSEQRGSVVAGETDLRLVTFGHLARFDSVQFEAPVRAQGLTTGHDSSFGETRFLDVADFTGATFEGTTDFREAIFHDSARFRRAHFAGPSSFQQSQFYMGSVFVRALFDDAIDFTHAWFGAAGSFDQATFDGPAKFRFVVSDGHLSFRQAHVLDTLNLDVAVFRDGISLAGVTTAGVVSLRAIDIEDEDSLRFEPVEMSALLMDVDTTQHIAGPRTRLDALEVLEDTALEAGDLALANDARYTVLALGSQQLETLPLTLDTMFYRGVTGYLVRPAHPLVTLLLVVVVASLIRAVSHYRSHETVKCSLHTVALGASRAAAWGVTESLRRAAKRRTSASSSDATSTQSALSVVIAVEAWVYTALIAILFITIGNSSATVRQVINAIQG